jgi:hypothetical protein
MSYFSRSSPWKLSPPRPPRLCTSRPLSASSLTICLREGGYVPSYHPYTFWTSLSGSQLRRRSRTPQGWSRGRGHPHCGLIGCGDPVWSSFFNLWTRIISIWSGLAMGASSTRPPQPTLLSTPYGAPPPSASPLQHQLPPPPLLPLPGTPTSPMVPMGSRLGSAVSNRLVQHHGADSTSHHVRLGGRL